MLGSPEVNTKDQLEIMRGVLNKWEVKAHGAMELTYEEFYDSFLGAFFSNAKDHDVHSVCRFLGLDGDGTISWSEFICRCVSTFSGFPERSSVKFVASAHERGDS